MLIVREKRLFLVSLLIFDDVLGRFRPGLRPFLPFIRRPAESILLTGNDRG